ncbi:unnamed protein product [Leptidea sinapis]|uniref:Uncharacterized protein n=1 Tax=Leptidea sinapis TaxID=189913 RepID=A0A5E4R524_9NEOP|nr:unnamed protein product [Leptidea sinapis]
MSVSSAGTPDSFALLQLVANDSYRMGQFLIAAKAFHMLDRSPGCGMRVRPGCCSRQTQRCCRPQGCTGACERLEGSPSRRQHREAHHEVGSSE